ncbi:MAG: Txe/YoeB family addiction module toxin [Rhodanobacteraceae bacterium]
MSRRIIFTDQAWDDYQYCQKTDRKLLRRINMLIDEAARDPFTGIGKPEPLRGDFSGAWSRRIDDTHRLVYEVQGDDLIIVLCRYHYHALKRACLPINARVPIAAHVRFIEHQQRAM